MCMCNLIVLMTINSCFSTDICNCALCASKEVEFLRERFITRLPDAEIHLSSSNLSNTDSTKRLEFNLDQWEFGKY